MLEITQKQVMQKYFNCVTFLRLRTKYTPYQLNIFGGAGHISASAGQSIYDPPECVNKVLQGRIDFVVEEEVKCFRKFFRVICRPLSQRPVITQSGFQC